MLSPVCGLRPTRERFSRTTKFPNPEILIFWPWESVRLIVIENQFNQISRFLLGKADFFVKRFDDIRFGHRHVDILRVIAAPLDLIQLSLAAQRPALSSMLRDLSRSSFGFRFLKTSAFFIKDNPDRDACHPLAT